VTFRAVVEHGEAATVLALAGELDMAAIPDAEAGMREALDDSPGRLVVDLSGVTFLDSSGIRLLLQAVGTARSRGVELAMTRPPEPVWRLLERFHLHERLPFVEGGPSRAAPPEASDDGAAAGDLDVELDADHRAPGLARRAAADAIPGSVRDTALLLISEVVTNAVRHGRTGQADSVRLSVTQQSGRLRVEVEDPGPGVPLQDPGDDPLRESGWGLVMVDRLATRWGTATDPSRVWFELDL